MLGTLICGTCGRKSRTSPCEDCRGSAGGLAPAVGFGVDSEEIPDPEPRAATPSFWGITIAIVLSGVVALGIVGDLGVESPFGVAHWTPGRRAFAFVVIWAAAAFVALLMAEVFAVPRPSVGDAEETSSSESEDEYEPDAPVPGLHTGEAEIQARLRDLAEQRERIEAVQALVSAEGESAALATVREKLDYAVRVLDEQKLRCGAQMWVLALVRWQNRLARLTEAAAGATHGEASRKLAALLDIRREGDALLAGWVADGPTAATREGSRCVAHLRELLGRCEQLRQGIVVREAMLAIRGIAPGDDAERTAALSIEPLESLQTDLGEGGSLTRALAELELEHERLRDDHGTARDVERFLGELESGKA